MVVLEDDVTLHPQFFQWMQRWLERDSTMLPGSSTYRQESWDMFHFGVGEAHGGSLSPIQEDDGCRAEKKAEGGNVQQKIQKLCYYDWQQQEVRVC